MSNGFYRIKYVLSFAFALVAAFFTYQTFMEFKATANFSGPVLILNTIIFLFLWFISFTSHTKFVKENIVLILVIPATGVYVTNFLTFLTTPTASLPGFLKYILASSTLLFASYHSRKYEEKLKKRKGRFA